MRRAPVERLLHALVRELHPVVERLGRPAKRRVGRQTLIPDAHEAGRAVDDEIRVRKVEPADVDDADQHARLRVRIRSCGRAGRRFCRGAGAHDRVRQRERFAHFDVRDSARRPLIHDLFDLARTQLRRHEISALVCVAWKLDAGRFGTGEPDETADAHGVRGRLIGGRLRQGFGLPRTLDRLLKLLDRLAGGTLLFLDFDRRGQLRAQVVHLLVAVADDAEARAEFLEVLLFDRHDRSTEVRSKK